MMEIEKGGGEGEGRWRNLRLTAASESAASLGRISNTFRKFCVLFCV